MVARHAGAGVRAAAAAGRLGGRRCSAASWPPSASTPPIEAPGGGTRCWTTWSSAKRAATRASAAWCAPLLPVRSAPPASAAGADVTPSWSRRCILLRKLTSNVVRRGAGLLSALVLVQCPSSCMSHCVSVAKEKVAKREAFLQVCAPMHVCARTEVSCLPLAGAGVC